jgi:hypothetical protein
MCVTAYVETDQHLLYDTDELPSIIATRRLARTLSLPDMRSHRVRPTSRSAYSLVDARRGV